jgi:hypothetical protein
MTHDSRFVIKTISTNEKLTLLNRLLPNYLERVFSHDSTLVRIYGVFQVQCVDNYSTSLVLMENVSFDADVSAKFDLKGSSYQREIFQGSLGLDLDFQSAIGSLELDREDAESLLRRGTKDSLMLAKNNIMDYSFLVTVLTVVPVLISPHHIYRSSRRDCFYLIAMIDILQEYDFGKKVETFWKTNVKRVALSSLSSVEPRLYSERLIEFLNKVV